MNTILSQLWNGNLCPVENSGKTDPEIQNLIILIERNGEKLNATLNDEEKNTFNNYIHCIEEYLSLSAEQAFSDGFSLASRILTEALTTEIN